MAKLVLKFEQSVLKEVAIGDRPITIGRLPDNDLQVDNLAVSSHHARIYREGHSIVVEDLGSLNGTFLNNQRVTKATARNGDTVLVGKHKIEVHDTGAADSAPAAPAAPKVAAPKIEETVMMDSKKRKELLEAALAAQAAGGGPAAPSAGPGQAAPSAPVAPPRVRVPSLIIIKGKGDQPEYMLTGKLTVIGKSTMATVKIRGFFARLFAPDVCAQINKRDDGYYVVKAAQIPKVNNVAITGPTKLTDGDTIEVGGLTMSFVYRE